MKLEIDRPNVWCLARNYLAHCHELNNTKPPAPIYFLKPWSSIVLPPQDIEVTAEHGRVDYEAEIVLQFNDDVKNVDVITTDTALRYVKAVTVGLDMTGRDAQAFARSNGMPWTLAKGQRTFTALCPDAVGPDELNMKEIHFQLKKNGEIVQKGDSQLMIFNIETAISYLSSFAKIMPNDLLMTGTPVGIGSVVPGDVLEIELFVPESKISATFNVVARKPLDSGVAMYTLPTVANK